MTTSEDGGTQVQGGASYEAEHVHSVYEEIASHFSSTRYKVCVAPSPHLLCPEIYIYIYIYNKDMD